MSMVVHACNPSTQEAEAGGSQVEASLGYTAGLFLKHHHQQQRHKKKYLLYHMSIASSIYNNPKRTKEEVEREGSNSQKKNYRNHKNIF
jgi:hypothetical protein